MAAGIVLGRSSIVIGACGTIGMVRTSAGLASTCLTSGGLLPTGLVATTMASSGFASSDLGGCTSGALTSAGPRAPPTPSVSDCLVGCSTVVLATGSVTTAVVTALVASPTTEAIVTAEVFAAVRTLVTD